MSKFKAERGYWVKSVAFNNSMKRTHFRDETEDGFVFRYWSSRYGGMWVYIFKPKKYFSIALLEDCDSGKS